MKRHRGGGRRALLTIPAVVCLLILSVGSALTATNNVPATRADDRTQAVEMSQLAPTECDGLTVANTASGSGLVTGTPENDWLVGSESIDTMDGLTGDDCIEGKGGADVISGGLGNDVCIGGPGIDTFVGCETEIQ